MNLAELASTAEHIRQVYEEQLTFNGLWEAITPQLPKGAVRPELDAPIRGDGLSPRRHLDIALDKARRPPRIALVGPFSSGKSTLLNAILHSRAANQMLDSHLHYDGRLLKVGDQVTTGNITELEFSGEDTTEGLAGASNVLRMKETDGAGAAKGPTSAGDLFQFSVQYLSEIELQGLFGYFNDKLGLGLSAEQFKGDGWIDRLKEALPPMHVRFTGDDDTNVRTNLRILWEIIESLRDPRWRSRVGKQESLGSGKAGLDAFNALLSRQKLEVQPTWEGNRDKLYKGPFHLVKFLRFRLPHPEFRGPNMKFSLFDFPGLGAGLHRDEYISRDFIVEANVIMVLYRPGVVGGAVVDHLLNTFAARRSGLSVESLLERIYFIHNGIPLKAPRDPNLTEFYQSFLQAVKNHLGPILDRKNVAAAARPSYLRKYLPHFLACDGQTAGYLRAGDNSPQALADLKNYQNRVAEGLFDCPTDPEILQRLSRDPLLCSATDGYPMLADMLSDAAVGAKIASVFTALKDQAGMSHLLDRVRDFVIQDGPRLQAEDVSEHLRAAVRPLAALTNLKPPTPPEGLEAFAAYDTKGQFDRALDFEDRWQKTLSVWENGERRNLTRDADLLEALAALGKAQDALEACIRAKVQTVMTAERLDRFRQPLKQPDGGFEKWLKEFDDAPASSPTYDFGDFDTATPGVGAPGLLRQNHTLLLYQYYLECRSTLLLYLYDELLPQFLVEVARLYQNTSQNVWEGFNKVWQRAVVFAEEKCDELDVELCERRLDLDVPEAFFQSMTAYTASAEWWPRANLQELLPRSGSKDCAGKFFGSELITTGTTVRISTWAPREKLPVNSNQLSVWLVRMKLLHIEHANWQRRQAPTLPAFGRVKILNVFKAVGLLDPDVNEDQVQFAEEEADFWKVPLPQLAGKLLSSDGRDMTWNPVPFDLFAGPFEQTAGLAKQLVQLPDGVVQRSGGQGGAAWRKLYLFEWQSPLLDGLRSVSDTSWILWRWLNEHGHRLGGVPPLEGKIQALREAIDSLRRAHLLEEARHP